MDTYIQCRSTEFTYKTVSTIEHSHPEIPGCTLHVDIYCAVPVLITTVFLKLNPRARNMYKEKIQ
jgi:hypothetical protein